MDRILVTTDEFISMLLSNYKLNYLYRASLKDLVAFINQRYECPESDEEVYKLFAAAWISIEEEN